MSAASLSPAARAARGLVAGVIGGAVASFAMDRFQAATSSLLASGGEDEEPATQKAADEVAKAATGQEVPNAAKPLAGQAIHYAIGIGLGAAYGVAAEFRPNVTAGHGAVFGFGTATLFDQGAVPALGLGDPLWKAAPSTTLYSYASHLAFGGVMEFVRRQVAGTLSQ